MHVKRINTIVAAAIVVSAKCTRLFAVSPVCNGVVWCLVVGAERVRRARNSTLPPSHIRMGLAGAEIRIVYSVKVQIIKTFG